ncbi:tyrosine-protein phosphatase [Eudoraea chungangensis]|uniref:tyrosine-protein phosphatase n=1 Tax=Eudoraea chungangensis TaxID=1481905 RepID=UPI0023EAD998|nr:CpsB/CapC family capsule biosynthesis tyrosine phosphatase [Eudoraea chungangensis]
MFQIFNKKKFLVDYLSGFIDIHNHILPGIDDGAKSVEDSIALIKGFSSIGISSFVATPHIMNNYYPNTEESISTSLHDLTNALLTENLTDIRIEAAAEHMIDDAFEDLLVNKQIMPLRKDFLLIEMSYLQPAIHFEECIESIMKNGFFPILAHPERYGYWHSEQKKYPYYKNKGVLYQLNLLSLSNYYGPEVKKMAYSLLDKGHIDFVASDVHNLMQLNNLKDLQISPKKIKKLLPLIENTISHFY